VLDLLAGPQPADDLDRLLEHLQAHVGRRPGVAEDVLVQRLPRADAELEAPAEHHGRRRRRLRDDRRVHPQRRARDRGDHRHAVGHLRERADHRPDERAVALRAGPRVVVVGDPQRVEPRVLGLARLAKQVVRAVLLARQEEADPHAPGATRRSAYEALDGYVGAISFDVQRA
jgi:hypothetical protein